MDLFLHEKKLELLQRHLAECDPTKNPQRHRMLLGLLAEAVRLACLTLKPREQMITHKLSQAVSDAADRGDVVIIFTEDV